MAEERPPNRLLREKSPYLLQHAHNPVDWHPWGQEALDKARQEGKLILLSIGYSTCHWCHVMEKESFEDEGVAAVLNELCVSIKVDREERPDLDQVYLKVCQTLTGSGGWPLTVLMTPEAIPFFAGTYFPKESRHGRIGLEDLVKRASALWHQDAESVRASGRDLVERLRAPALPHSRGAALHVETLRVAQAILGEEFDEARGGFGAAPKFPTPHNLVFLLRRHRRTGAPQPLRVAASTLGAMAKGGLFDHLGFGFHRYSTDAEWLVPHFEKMLYDQAGLASAYVEAFQLTGETEWADTARRVFTYVLRDLAGPDGGFCAAEDADSDGEEGKFYVWEKEEILETVGPTEGDLFCRVYGVRDEGNFREEATRQLTGRNILHLTRPMRDWAVQLGSQEAPLRERLEASRRLLFAKREQRVRPHRDDKIIASWNGLMISALAKGASALGDSRYAEAAGRAADFVLTSMRRGGRLLRRYCDGEAAVPAFAEDHALLARGLLDLYGATFRAERLRQAVELSRELLHRFWDDVGEGLFDTASDAEALVLRPQEVHDGATPSANSVALEVFARLFLLTGDAAWQGRADALAEAFADRVAYYPAAYTQFLQGASFLLEPTREVVVTGEEDAEDTRALLTAVQGSYTPETATLYRPAADGATEISLLAPYSAQMKPLEGKAAAYVCQGFACRAPTCDAGELRTLLRSPPP